MPSVRLSARLRLLLPMTAAVVCIFGGTTLFQHVLAQSGAGGVTVTGIRPAVIPTATGGPVNIVGTNFTTNGTTPISVMVDGVMATNVRLVSPQQVDAIFPPHAAGSVEFFVATPSGSSAPFLAQYSDQPVAVPNAVAPGAGPSLTLGSSAQTGFCCIPSYARDNGGQCLPDPEDPTATLSGLYTPYLDPNDPSGASQTEANCKAAGGSVFNNDEPLCNVFCGRTLKLFYCDPNPVETPMPAYTCRNDKVVERRKNAAGDFIDPPTIGFGYKDQASCQAVCIPPVDVRTEVLCPQACTDSDYVCRITVTNLDQNRDANIRSVSAEILMESGSEPDVTLSNGKILTSDSSEAASPVAPVNNSPTWAISETSPITIPAGGSFVATVSVSPESAGDLGTMGRLQATADNPGDLNPSDNIDFDDLVAGNADNCDLTATDQCESADGRTDITVGASNNQLLQIVTYSVAVPAERGRLTLPVPVCLSANDVIIDDVQDGDCIYNTSATEGTNGSIDCTLNETSGGQVISFSAAIDTGNSVCIESAVIRNIATLTPAGSSSVNTNTTSTTIHACSTCSACDSFSDKDSCERDADVSGTTFCTWSETSGSKLSVGVCRPNPENAMCDYAYACCTGNIAERAPAVAGDGTDPNLDFIFGSRRNGRDADNPNSPPTEFLRAKACAEDEVNRVAIMPMDHAVRRADPLVTDLSDACLLKARQSSSPSGSFPTPPFFVLNVRPDLFCPRELGKLCNDGQAPLDATGKRQCIPREPGTIGIERRPACSLRNVNDPGQKPTQGAIFFETAYYSIFPYNSANASFMTAPVGNIQSGLSCEDECAQQVKVGTCCMPNVRPEDNCLVLDVDTCDGQNGVNLDFTQERSAQCQQMVTSGACNGGAAQ